MNVPDPPTSVVIRLTDGDTLRGTLVEEQSDGWLLEEETGRLIHVYSQDVKRIDPCEKSE